MHLSHRLHKRKGSSLYSRLEHRLSRNLEWKILSAIEGKKKSGALIRFVSVCIGF